MTSPHRLGRAQRRARLAFVGLAVSSGFLVAGPAGANPPNQGGVSSSSGTAPYTNTNGAASYDAPKPAGVGTGRKIG